MTSSEFNFDTFHQFTSFFLSEIMPLAGQSKKCFMLCVVCSKSVARCKLSSHLREHHFLSISPSCGLCFEAIGQTASSADSQDEQSLVKLETRSNDTLKHLEKVHKCFKVGLIIYFISIALYCSFAHKNFAHYKSVRICAILCTARSHFMRTCSNLRGFNPLCAL